MFRDWIRFDRNELAGAFGDIGTDLAADCRDDSRRGARQRQRADHVRRDADFHGIALRNPDAGATVEGDGDAGDRAEVERQRAVWRRVGGGRDHARAHGDRVDRMAGARGAEDGGARNSIWAGIATCDARVEKLCAGGRRGGLRVGSGGVGHHHRADGQSPFPGGAVCHRAGNHLRLRFQHRPSRGEPGRGLSPPAPAFAYATGFAHWLDRAGHTTDSAVAGKLDPCDATGRGGFFPGAAPEHPDDQLHLLADESGQSVVWRRPDVPRLGGNGGHYTFGARTGGSVVIYGCFI